MALIPSSWPTRGLRVLAAVFVIAATASCGETARTGRSSALLIINSLEVASGADPTKFSSVLNSDVETLVPSTVNGQTVSVPTVFNDPATVTLRVEMKNPLNPTVAGAINDITITRYHVDYRRSDGRNTQGVDVPYSFDGAFTITVPLAGTATGGFDIVRHQAKQEPPLRNMRGGGATQLLTVIAEVTFYGRDQAGNEITATGSVSINFADFGDPS
jgi:hypothetical protein